MQGLQEIQQQNEKNGTHNQEHVQVYKEVERFKLGVWLVKSISLFVFAIVAVFIFAYGYVAVTNEVLTDLDALTGLLSGFFDVVKTVLAP